MPTLTKSLGLAVRHAEVEAQGVHFPLCEEGNGRWFSATHLPASLTALFGRRLGPYPGTGATLWLTVEDGSKRSIPLTLAAAPK